MQADEAGAGQGTFYCERNNCCNVSGVVDQLVIRLFHDNWCHLLDENAFLKERC